MSPTIAQAVVESLDRFATVRRRSSGIQNFQCSHMFTRAKNNLDELFSGFHYDSQWRAQFAT
jgi:hypothetical protein